MRAVVVDTSALIRLYVPDGPLPDGLEAAVDAAWRGEALLMAPDLLLAEVGQVLRKKERAGYLRKEESDEILAAVLALPIEVLPHRALLADALDLARETNLTVYDALFLALAKGRGAALFSADERLANCLDGLASR